MGHINRPRDREHAPTNSGSSTKPERVNVRCTTEECGRLYNAIRVARQLRLAKFPNAKERELDMATLLNHVIIPTFEKVVRGFVNGSAAEKAFCGIFLEEFVRKDDYLSTRRQITQQMFDL